MVGTQSIDGSGGFVMFDQRTQLLERLRPVSRSLRVVQFWRLAASVLVIITLVAWTWASSIRDGRVSSEAAITALLVLSLFGIMVVGLVAARSFRNFGEIAARVERRFPSLQQRLMTAIDLVNGNTDQPLGYLQRRVIEEAFSHSKTHRWTDVVPMRRLVLSRLAGFAAIAMLAGTLSFLVIDSPPVGNGMDAPLVQLAKRSPIVVEPGNTQIERGTSLIVTARFDAVTEIDGQVELICIDMDGSERRYPMRQTLDDPIASAFVASVSSTMRYQVVSSQRQSEIYTAEVFDYPALVRSDAELTFPSYTSLPKKRIEDTLRVAMVEGTRLRWELNLNKPVTDAMLVAADGQQLTLVPDVDNRSLYYADFEMSQSQRWRLELVDHAGRQNKFPPELIARVFPNEPPAIKLVAGGDAEVSPLEELAVAATVRDDFGVERFGISYHFPGGASGEIILGESIAKGETRRADQMLDFESLNAKADQLLTYYFWAEDKDRDGNVRKTSGDLHFVEVRPFEAIYREDQSSNAPSAQQQQQGGENGRQAEELAELQKQIINATWKVIRREMGDAPTEKLVVDVNTIATSQDDALQHLNELATKVTDDQSVVLVEQATESMQASLVNLQNAAEAVTTMPLESAVAAQQAAYQALLGLRAREFQVSRSQQSQQSGSASASQQRRQQQLDQLELKNDENRYETQSRAQSEQAQQEAGAQREVIDRLRELAQRQEDINQQVAQLQSALELAQTEAEREEVLRQLKRLREQEQELLRDADELGERMQQASQQSPATDAQPMEKAAEQLEQTRENIRQASDALAQNDASEALAAGTRAERELDQVREDLREEAAGSFNDTMRQIRSDARELDERQQEIGSQLGEAKQETPAAGPGLRPEAKETDVVADLEQQRQRLSDLLKQVEQTVQDAESTEPLLAQDLYDTYRNTQQQKVDQKLSDAAELLRRGLQPQAEGAQSDAADAISELRERLEKATDSVLGDQTKALERALGELEQLREQLDGEIAEATGQANPGEQGNDENPSRTAQSDDGKSAAEPGSSNEPQNGDQAKGMTSPGQQPGGEQPGGQQPGGEQPGGQQPGGEQPGGQQPGGQQPGGQQPGGQQRGGQQAGGEQPGGQQPGGEQPGGQQSGGQQSGGQQSGGPEPGQGSRMIDQIAQSASGANQEGGLAPGGGRQQAAPLTGEGFRDWSDRLRDVEKMIEDPAMRSEATRIRERASEVRSELRRHSKAPQWDEVEEMIAKPLRELTQEVAEELLRRSADRHAIVPLDRDPVPDRYSEAVRRYYENLGGGR